MPSWSSPRTPILSMIRPFSLGKDLSTGGVIGWILAFAGMTGVGDGVFLIGLSDLPSD